MNYKELIKRDLETIEEETDPMLSVVNMIDVFLAIVIALMIVLINSPLNPFTKDEYVMVKNPGKEKMEIVIKKGEKLERYVRSSGVGEGEGVKVGTTYRLPDGTLIYTPEE